MEVGKRREVTRPVLSAPLLASAMFTAAVLAAAALFFLFAPLTVLFLSFAAFLSALSLSGRSGFVRLIWIVLCTHDAFVVVVELMFRSFVVNDPTFLINRCEERFGLKHAIGMTDGCLIRQNPTSQPIIGRIQIGL